MKVRDILTARPVQQGEEPSAVVNLSPEEEVDWSQAEAGAGEAEAVTWLRSKLSPGPRQIAPLIAEWVGERDGAAGRWIDDLMQARWTLGVLAYVGEDERFWWRLPESACVQ